MHTNRSAPAEAESIRWRLTLALLLRLPQGALSRLAGRLADLRFPRVVQGWVNRAFAWAVGVDTHEAELPPEDYPSLGAFFVRGLRDGVRSWPSSSSVPASPVDGIVGAMGEVREGVALQAKGMPYSVGELLGDSGFGRRFEGGRFLTVYLSPRHYHRIHAPVSGMLHRARAIPGRLLPVNLPAIRGVEDLFPRNERLVAHLRTGERGREVALIAVGAFNVGRISAAFDESWDGAAGLGVTNLPGRAGVQEREYDPPVAIRRGDEIMAFHLGSTVVLLFESGEGGSDPRFAPEVNEGAEIALGAALFE